MGQQTGDDLPKHDLKPLLHRVQIRQVIDREWRGELNPYEYALVTFVYDRTVAWGKRYEVIALREFTGGRAGHFAGTGISRNKVISTMNTLVYRGIITRDGNNTARKRYMINLLWEPGMGLPPRKTDNKAQAKGLATRKSSPRRDTFSPQCGPQLAHSVDPLKENTKIEPKGTESAARSPVRKRSRTKGIEAIAAASEKAVAHGAAKTAKRKASLKASDRQAAWKDAVAEHWPEAVAIPWSPKTRGLYGHAVKNGAFKDVAVGDYFEWVVAEWGLIINSVFAWMKDAPEYPNPEFAMVHLYRFLPAYADREALRRAFDEHGPKAVEAAYRRRGFSPEQAGNLAAKDVHKATGGKSEEQEALDAQRRELERDKQILARQRRHYASQAPAAAPIDTPALDDVSPTLAPLPDVNFEEDL